MKMIRLQSLQNPAPPQGGEQKKRMLNLFLQAAIRLINEI
jgi:hypothetical protein